MPPIDYGFGPPTSSTHLKWSTLLPREDSQRTRASISRRLDFLEKRIRGRIPSSEEIVQMCDEPLDHEVIASLQTVIKTTLPLMIHASINTGDIGWLDDSSLHYRFRLLDDPAPVFNDDTQLRRELYSSTITKLEKAIASANIRDARFMAKPLECLAHCGPTSNMLKVGSLCKKSGSAMMRKLFYIATAYTVPSNRNTVPSHRCEDTECSHIDCQYNYTNLN